MISFQLYEILIKSNEFILENLFGIDTLCIKKYKAQGHKYFFFKLGYLVSLRIVKVKSWMSKKMLKY
jgi:hypothetical protein